MAIYRGVVWGLMMLGMMTACAEAPGTDVGPVRFRPADFVPVSQFRAGANPALAVLDVNGDELPDVFVGRAGASDLLLVQDRTVGWRLNALSGTEDTPAAALAVDLNADFRPDLVVARETGLFVWLNQQGGALQPGYRIASWVSGGDGMLLSAGDINGDGWTDLVYAQRTAGAPQSSARLHILVNAGPASGGRAAFDEFDQAPQSLCCGINALLVADMNEDRWPDVVVVGEGALHIVENRGGEVLRARAVDAVSGGQGFGAADYDADGDLDLLVTRTQGGAQAVLLRNDGGFAFADVSSAAAVSGAPGMAAPAWVDVDADGLIDVMLSPDQWLRQGQPGRFERLRFTFADGVAAPRGQSLVADFDRDGSVDQLVAGPDGALALFHNEYTRNHWLAVRLRGHANGTTLGARVRLNTRDGKTLVRHQLISSSAPSNQADELVFGIGRRTELSSAEIDWATGSYTRVDGPLIDRRIGFIEPPRRGARHAVLRHPLLESIKHRTSPLDLVCR